MSERGRDRMSVVVVTGANGGTALPIPTDVADQEQIDGAARPDPDRPGHGMSLRNADAETYRVG